MQAEEDYGKQIVAQANERTPRLFALVAQLREIEAEIGDVLCALDFDAQWLDLPRSLKTGRKDVAIWAEQKLQLDRGKARQLMREWKRICDHRQRCIEVPVKYGARRAA